MNVNTRKITAQIACEAIINSYGDGYTLGDVLAVAVEAQASGVHVSYTERVREIADRIEAEDGQL